ncbi:MAG: type I glutamate--ammonia ligase [Phycisphaerae bacterium]
MFDSGADAAKYISDHRIAMVDLKVAGVAGQWLHVTLPAGSVGDRLFNEGVGFDGSSGAGFGMVLDSDVAALPRPETGFMDPFWHEPTISFICDAVTADTKDAVPTDPRTIAKRAVEHMKKTKIADVAAMGPEFEFHVFNRVHVVSGAYDTGVSIQCSEVDPDGATPAIPAKRGYMRVPPSDQLGDLRSEIALTLERLGVPVRYHHHEVGAPGQCEIEVNLTDLVTAADRAMLIKYVVKNVTRRHDKLATFMPKPVFGEAGNGMHVHQKLERTGRNLFYDKNRNAYADLSEIAEHYIGGLLEHGRALTGLTNPSTNSFKRLVEGYEAPVNLFYSLGNRSAAIRVPRYAVNESDKRIEYRPPDFTGNVYLSLAAMLMAGLDGVTSKTDAKTSNFGPFDVDIAAQSEAFRSQIAPVPRSLHDALAALQEDHAFLLEGGVFNEPFISHWIKTKLSTEAREVAARPHPHEFSLYLDA